MQKRFGLLMGMALVAFCSLATAGEKDDLAGSNVTGTEVVCNLDGTDEQYKDSLARCRRGDILSLGRTTWAGVMAFCDFTKTVVYQPNSPGACVYTGTRRADQKRKE